MSSPLRVDPAAGPWPLHDADASRALEQAALGRSEAFSLMARAGLAVARLARARWPHAQRVQVWAGPGNNGGDGLVAARHLHAAGCTVQVALLADPARLPEDARRALTEAEAAGVALTREAGSALAAPDLAIDALLGLGARRAPQGEMAAAIEALGRANTDVLSVDLPSGLHPDTGQPLGAVCVRATATLALLTLKPGLFTAHGRDAAGEIWFDDLGIAAQAPTARLAGAMESSARAHASHKGRHGDVAVVGGARGMSGAAWLAARAALAAGAGRVHASLLDPGASLLDPAWPELMGRAAWWQSPAEVLASTTVVAGCGGGTEVAATLPALLARAGRLVVDADGLNALAADEALLAALQRRARSGRPTLLTPHPLEAARLLGCTAAAVQADRLAAAGRLAQLSAATVLLKGSGSVVASAGALPLIVPTGNAALATAGTGDVLAGWAAGLWAQAPGAAAATIAAQAAWAHGRAADLWPAAARGAPLRASELIGQLARREA